MNLLKIGAIALSIAAITACSSDDEKELNYGELKFYNASSNSGAVDIVALENDDKYYLASIDVFNTSPNYFPDVSDYELLVTHQQPHVSEAITLSQTPFSITEDMLSLLVLNGEATTSELLSFTIDFSSVETLISEDKSNETQSFEIRALNLSQSYNDLSLYYSLGSAEFSEAQIVTSLGVKELSQPVVMPQGEYTFYLADANGTPMYQSAPINVEYQESYVLAIRDDLNGKNLVMDRFSKTSPVYHHYSQIAPATLRFYQSANALGDVDLYLGEVDNEPTLSSLTADVLSQSIVAMTGDITMSLTAAGNPEEVLFDNSLLSLTHRDDKHVFFYQDDEQVTRSLVLDQYNHISAFENHVTIVNLTAKEQPINAYLVDSENSISETPFHKDNVAFSEHVTLSSAQSQFEIVITNTPSDQSSDQFIFAQSQLIDFSPNANYLVVVEPNSSTSSGYAVSVIKL
ncbi:MAG: hypothetical protein ACPGR2_11045 [Psychrobium sp.]